MYTESLKPFCGRLLQFKLIVMKYREKSYIIARRAIERHFQKKHGT